ncbi:hypothetical protein Trisim1_009582 [Trichoderma cf. simile WF8]
MMPSIRRYHQSYHPTLAAKAAATFLETETEPEPESEAEEVIEVIPATQIEEDKPDEQAG